ncbi:MAG TPA: phosphoribosylamine--glycine ligase [Polyangiaceae bacterium]|nr:phosphoribosylamine--glycine ligase [Polyangiaceae bacterium]
MKSGIARVLVLGSGAREHALARAMSKTPAREIVVAPGNGGTSGPRIATRGVDLADVGAVVALAKDVAPDLVVVGPEAPLVVGVADALEAAGFLVFGPRREAARLEASKAFMKEVVASAGVPTARFFVVRSMAEAERAIDALGGAPVIKADGLCAGKGVVVASSRDEAISAARAMLEERVFGDAGATVVVEERIPGREVSLHAISDGERFVLLPPARDHKRIGDGDRGPNTGGMGVVCPAPGVDAAMVERMGREAIEPTLRAMRERGAPFRGVLFAGLMVTDDGTPYLLEHNVRFGDPECEALMEMLDGDVAELLASAARGALDPSLARVAERRAAAVVVLAARGYPEKPVTGDAIHGLERAAEIANAVVLHAGTRAQGGALITAGGRVLAVTAHGETLEDARRTAYRAASRIRFEGMQLRRDIGGAPIALDAG